MITSLTPIITSFAATNCKPTFFGLVPWYQYLTLDGNCNITSVTNSNVISSHSPLLLIVLAIVDDLIRIAALVAVGYIIYGGITYIISQGSPDQTKKAQSTVINALIGLVLAVTAASIVSFIGNKLTVQG